MSSDADACMAWEKSVTVQIGRRAREIIRTPAEALIFLTNKWPSERGPQYQTAKEICLAALRRRIGNEAARASFILAASEAKLMI